MNFFYLDASAWVKRYVPEPGSEEVDELFARVALSRMMILFIGVGEIISILVRRRNAGIISQAAQRQAVAELQNDVMNELFALKRVRDEIAGHGFNGYIHPAFAYIERFGINVTDALILTSALRTAFELREQGHDLVLVSSDARLLRAATGVELQAWNPELDAIALLDEFLV